MDIHRCEKSMNVWANLEFRSWRFTETVFVLLETCQSRSAIPPQFVFTCSWFSAVQDYRQIVEIRSQVQPFLMRCGWLVRLDPIERRIRMLFHGNLASIRRESCPSILYLKRAYSWWFFVIIFLDMSPNVRACYCIRFVLVTSRSMQV